MLVLDAKTTFLDDDGKPLSGGRLRYFAFATTTPVSVYADGDYITPLGSVVALTSAGWTSTGIYAQQSVTVHVDRYLGMDEFGAENYEEIKVYDYITSASSGGGSDSSIVDIIEDLRAIAPTDGLMVTVKGYYDVTDCFPRTYIWDATSSAVENLGTVIESNVEPTGRWLLGIEGYYVDSRIFGVIAGLQTTNSAFAQHLAYCSTYKRSAYYVTGDYYLTSGGSLTASCAIKADKNVTINSTSGTYTITVNNTDFDISNTFAGTGLKLIIDGANWKSTWVPMTAFDPTAKGYELGSAEFSIILNNLGTVYEFTEARTYGDIRIEAGTHTIKRAPVNVNAGKVTGIGLIEWSTNDQFAFEQINTSNFANYVSETMDKVTDLITLDSAVTIGSISITAYVHAEGLGTLTPSSSATMTGGYGGKPKFILGVYGINVGDTYLDAQFFDDPYALVQSYNMSTSIYDCDMKGGVSTALLTRSGYVRNGTISRVTGSSVRLENMHVNGDITSADVTASKCVFAYNGDILPNLTSSNFDNVTITSTGYINCYNGVWREVTINGASIKSTGGVARLRDVNCVNALFIPDSSHLFGNFSWIGGSATSILFDATQQSTDGDSVAFNVIIKELLSLTGNINKSNGSTKRWAVNGHYNVQIGDNEGSATRRTYGTSEGYINVASGDVGLCASNAMFLFRTDSGPITSGRLITIASRVQARPFFGGPNLVSTDTGGEFQGATIRYRKAAGSTPNTGDSVTLTYKVYK